MHVPKVPSFFDADDWRTVARLVVVTFLVFWMLTLLGAAIGLGVRVFFLAKGA